MANYLIIGGAGFIGSHLCEYLVRQNNNQENTIVVADNYSTGSKANHIRNTHIHYEFCDVSVGMQPVEDFDPDYVFHFGEYSRVEQSFNDIGYVYKNNMNGILNVVNYCYWKNAKLIYSGSSTKFTEQGKDLSPYTFTKVSNVDFIKSYDKWYGLDHAIVYFYNAYGPREISSGTYATLIAKFFEKVKHNQPLTVVEPGTQVRNFTHVNDIVSALDLVAKYGQGDGYGIGADKSYSVKEVAEMLSNDIEFLPPRQGNRMTAELVTDKTKALGWEPTHNLEDYLKEQLEVLKNG